MKENIRVPSLFDVVKTYFYRRNAEKWILERLEKIPYAPIGRIKSTFKNLRYAYLQKSYVLAGSYQNDSKTISIYGKENINQIVCLHEMLHACSSKDDYLLVVPNNTSTEGITGRFNSCVMLDKVNTYVDIWFGEALNEGATEFFTEDILNEKRVQCTYDDAYNNFVNIFSIFSNKVCDGQVTRDDDEKNTLFKFYINADFNGLIDHLSERYNSPKSLVLSLVLQMDKCLVKTFGLTEYQTNDMLVRCYTTLYRMHFNKFLKENKGSNLQDFLKSDEIKKIANLHLSKLAIQIKNIAQEIFIQEFKSNKNNKKENFQNFHKYLMNVFFNVMADNDELYLNSHTGQIILQNAMVYDYKFEDAVKKFTDQEKVNALLFLGEPTYLQTKYTNFKEVINRQVSVLIKSGLPKDIGLRNEFIFYLLNLQRFKNIEAYKNISSDEIWEYVNNDKMRYRINISNIKCNKKLKEYYKTAKKYAGEMDNNETKEMQL